jgi:MSHA biogenesis protein MshQ
VGTCQAPVVTGPPLLLRWTLDEETGVTALDSTSNALHGTYLGDCGTPAPSPLVPAVMFPDPRSRVFVRASRHAVQLAPMPALLKPANNFTITLWFQASSVDAGGAELLSGGNQYLLRIGADGLRFSKRPAGGSGSVQCEVSGNGHLDGKWHHLAAVQSPAGMKVYLDGIERCTNTHGEDVRYDGGPTLFLGRHPESPSYDFDGNLDDVRLYGGALSPAQVQALSQGGN